MGENTLLLCLSLVLVLTILKGQQLKMQIMVLILQLSNLFIFSPDTLVIPRQIAIIPLQTLRFFGLFLLQLGNDLFVFSNLMIVQLLNAHSFFLRLINFIDELLLKIYNLSLLDG